MNLLPYFLIFFAAVLRLLPHPANFAPVAAVALFGAVYLKGRQGLFVPLAAMIFSDFILGFDSWHSRLIVYGSFILVWLIGTLVRRRKNLATVLTGTLAGGVVFYLVTNFALFYPPVMYSHDWSGIFSSYFNALPFFRNSLLGDIFYVAILFGTYEMVLAWKHQTVKDDGLSPVKDGRS